jgi:Spy/CpxP family protein refolding chaperone
MKTLTKNKWFLFLLGFLFLANIALLLSFFVFGEKSSWDSRSRSTQPTKGYLAKELQLTKEQDAEFNKMKEEFFKRMKPLWAEIRMTKDSLFRQMNNPAMDDSAIDAFTERIAAKNRIADELMFRHFRELRKQCTPEQQLKFDTLIPQMLTHSGSRGHSSKK